MPRDHARAKPAFDVAYSIGEISHMLNKSADWLRHHRFALQDRGMPPPIDQPGHPRWSRARIDAWIIGYKRQLAAANDTAPLPAPEVEAWDPFLRQVYARR